jgi:hypothetical protein
MEAMVEVLMSKFDQMCCNLIFDPMFFLNIFIIKKIKKYVLDTFVLFSTFLTSPRRIQISNFFLTRSTFSVSFLKSLVFLIESAMILPFSKKIKIQKIKK